MKSTRKKETVERVSISRTRCNAHMCSRVHRFPIASKGCNRCFFAFWIAGHNGAYMFPTGKLVSLWMKWFERFDLLRIGAGETGSFPVNHTHHEVAFTPIALETTWYAPETCNWYGRLNMIHTWSCFIRCVQISSGSTEHEHCELVQGRLFTLFACETPAGPEWKDLFRTSWSGNRP